MSDKPSEKMVGYQIPRRGGGNSDMRKNSSYDKSQSSNYDAYYGNYDQSGFDQSGGYEYQGYDQTAAYDQQGYEQQYDYQQAGNNISSLGNKMLNSYGGGGAQATSGASYSKPYGGGAYPTRGRGRGATQPSYTTPQVKGNNDWYDYSQQQGGGQQWNNTGRGGGYNPRGRGGGRGGNRTSVNNLSGTKRKMIVEEVGGGTWINEYDQPLPQDIIAQCTSYVCNICNVNFSSDVTRIGHYQGKPHEKKVDALLKTKADATGEPPAKKKKASIVANTESTINLDRLKHFQRDYLSTWTQPLPDLAIEMMRPHRCEVCKLNFNNPVDATTHMMGRPHDKKMTDWINSYCKEYNVEVPTKVSGCIYSGESEEPNNDSNTAAAAAENDLGYYKCDVCNVTSSSFSAHNIHIKGKKHQKSVEMTRTTTWANSLFRCEICMITSSNQENLDKHLTGKAHLKKVRQLEYEQAQPAAGAQQPQREAKSEQGTFSCEVCNVFVNSADILKIHMEGKSHAKKMNSQNSQEFRCDVCDITVNSAEILAMHNNGKKHASKLKQKENEAENKTDTKVEDEATREEDNTK